MNKYLIFGLLMGVYSVGILAMEPAVVDSSAVDKLQEELKLDAATKEAVAKGLMEAIAAQPKKEEKDSLANVADAAKIDDKKQEDVLPRGILFKEGISVDDFIAKLVDKVHETLKAAIAEAELQKTANGIAGVPELEKMIVQQILQGSSPVVLEQLLAQQSKVAKKVLGILQKEAVRYEERYVVPQNPL